MATKAAEVKTIRADYAVKWVPTKQVVPSPENDDVYGIIKLDDAMQDLIDSITIRGLEEPIIVSSDNYIVSGHRRFFAVQQLGITNIPIRVKNFSRASKIDEWHKVLTEYNPQRIKSTLTLLKEAMLKRSDGDPRELLESWDESSLENDAEYTEVHGFKKTGKITSQRQSFLKAAQEVIEKMKTYWPLTVRQVHYQLLNDPPLKRVCSPRSKVDPEKSRYKNDAESYKALVRLLKDARYAGLVSLRCIDDPTRPFHHYHGYDNLGQFLNSELTGFLTGYYRNRQSDQPRHIEVLGEKNTLLQILKPVCAEYHVPLSLSRGYGTIPLWRQIASRYRASGKKRMSLVVVSDFDPEGMDLPKDAVRSLKDFFGVRVDYHRVAVNREQIDELDLAEDFNPAKVESSRFNTFVEETGGEDTWECEAIPPRYLQDQLRAAIEANMDMDIYRECEETELREADELHDIRQQIVEGIDL